MTGRLPVAPRQTRRPLLSLVTLHPRRVRLPLRAVHFCCTFRAASDSSVICPRTSARPPLGRCPRWRFCTTGLRRRGAEAIRDGGFETLLSDDFEDGLAGVYVCSSPELHLSLGVSLLTLQIPDDELRLEWSEPCLENQRATDWYVPRNLADRFLIPPTEGADARDG